MDNLRSYGDPCGIARALDLVGERWALLIVRELCFGPKRFTDLRAGLVGASPNVLSQRLRELEAGNVVVRRQSGAASYELTDFGRDLHPLLVALGRWGARSAPPRGGTLGTDALLLALEATFSAQKSGVSRGNYALRLGEQRYVARVSKGHLELRAGEVREPSATITTDPATLRGVVFGDKKLSAAELVIEGDEKLGRAFLRSFERP